MEKFNAAVIGCGAISDNHSEAVASCPEANLAAVCDLNRERAAAAASKYQSRSFTDFDDVLQNAEIDVVHLCTPHYLHAPMAIAAMKAGKHVLTEKPMAISVDQAKEMIRISKETGKTLGICFQNRYNATSLKIREILSSGSAGKILGARAFVTWYRNKEYYAESDWRGTWEKEGGGVLINQAIHTLDLLQWFLGGIEAIKASVDTRLLQDVIEVEDTAEATIKFTSGATALFYATNCYPVNSPVFMELACEKAVIQLSDDLKITFENGEAEIHKNNDLATGAKSYWGLSHTLLIHDFYSRLKDGKAFGIDGGQGIEAIRMIDAIYRSNKSKQYEKLV